MERVYGIEISPPLIEKAKDRLTLFQIDIEAGTIPLGDQSVGLVIINQVLEHLKNVYFCLAECERVLQIGGHLAIGIPNLAGLVNRLYLLLGRQPMCHGFPGPHVRAFTHRAFLRFIDSNSAFTRCRSIGSSLYPVPPPLMERLARLLPGWSAYTFYLLKKVEHRPNSAWLNEAAQIGSTAFRH